MIRCNLGCSLHSHIVAKWRIDKEDKYVKKVNSRYGYGARTVLNIKQYSIVYKTCIIMNYHPHTLENNVEKVFCFLMRKQQLK